MSAEIATKTKPSSANADRHDYVLRLYVSGANRKSQNAIVNLNAICDEYLQGQYELEVVDLYQYPETADQAQILATPTLVKEAPLPMRRIIGDLSQKDRVLLLLNLKKK